jgi:hypothetical protein
MFAKMKCNIKKLATMLIILFGVPQTVIAQTFSVPTGTTAQDPFTNLAVIHQINGAGPIISILMVRRSALSWIPRAT